MIGQAVFDLGLLHLFVTFLTIVLIKLSCVGLAVERPCKKVSIQAPGPQLSPVIVEQVVNQLPSVVKFSTAKVTEVPTLDESEAYSVDLALLAFTGVLLCAPSHFLKFQTVRTLLAATEDSKLNLLAR